MADTSKELEKAIFPIIRRRLGVVEDICGTGCFINEDGLILTCAHIMDVPSAEYLLAPYPYNLDKLVPIEWCRVDHSLDLAIGRALNLQQTEVMPFTYRMVPPKDSAVQVPGFRYSTIRMGTLLQKQAQIEWISGTCVGHSNEISLPAGDYQAKRYPAMLSAPPLTAGFSGSPVIDDQGHLCAIHVASVIDDPDPMSFNVRLDAIGHLLNLFFDHITQEQFDRATSDFGQHSPDDLLEEEV